MIKNILFVLAAIFFCLAGANVPRAQWQWFACACVVIALFIPV
jgi:hypothetical protein